MQCRYTRILMIWPISYPTALFFSTMNIVLQWTGVGTAVAAVGVSMYGVASLLYWWLDRWAVPKVYYFCDSLHVRNSLCPPLVPGEVSSPPLLWERPQYVLYSVASLLYWSLVTGQVMSSPPCGSIQVPRGLYLLLVTGQVSSPSLLHREMGLMHPIKHFSCTEA